MAKASKARGGGKAMRAYEGSKADKVMEKRMPMMKEGSKAEVARDRAAMRKAMTKKGGK